MADGDPVTATSPVKNGNRCQFLFEYTPLSTPSRTDRKDLVAGSGLTFEDAGEHELKGVPDRWRVYAVVSD
jgi:hypothetical protein